MSKYKDSLSIKNTDFPMQANLSKLEPKISEQWYEQDIYSKLQESNKPTFTMHYGPPYLNGPFHIGHGLNMILKDFILRSRNLLGYKIDSIPGFDCHGLPIELKVQKTFTPNSSLSPIENIRKFREECIKFNNSWLDVQLSSVKRMGILASKEYYMTAKSTNIIYKTFSDMLLKNMVSIANKPVIWSINEQTTIADSEIEYKNKISKSIFFILKITKSPLSQFQNVYLTCWTTTPWTLVDNSAVAYNPNITYCFTEYQDKILIVAEKCIENLEKVLEIKLNVLAKFSGQMLTEMEVEHPIRKNEDKTRLNVPLVAGAHVMDSEGTGFVHTAPSHGLEDFEMHLLHSNVKSYESTNELGYYIKGSPLEGLHIFDDENKILESYLDIALKIVEIEHSYPYSQRTNTPIIYRSTEQIFIKIHKEVFENILYDVNLIEDKFNTYVNYLKGNSDIKSEKSMKLIEECFDFIGIRLSLIESSPLAVEFVDLIILFERILIANFETYSDRFFEKLIKFENSDKNSDFAHYFDLIKCKLSAFIEISRHLFSNYILNQNKQIISLNEIKYNKLDMNLVNQVMKVTTVPVKLKTMLLDTLNGRKEWCVSRQRIWGVPLALFVDKRTNGLFINDRLQIKIILKMKEDPSYFLSADCINILDGIVDNKENYRPYLGVLDVWFDSGCVFNILPNKQADVYCEGKDQIRGWFQSSLWVSYLTTGQLPYKAIISHGFLLDEQKNKMSKSLGNVRDFNQLIETLGRDVLNMWIARSDTSSDIKISDQILSDAADMYRKIRNVLRYLISITEDLTDNEKKFSKFEGELENMFLDKYNQMEHNYFENIENYHFKEAFDEIYQFILDLSGIYFNARKDSLYCDLNPLETRQFMHFLLHNIIILLSVFLPFTTEEISIYLKYSKSIHLFDKNDLLKLNANISYKVYDEIMNFCIPIRQDIDILKKTNQIKKSSELILYVDSNYVNVIENLLQVGRCIKSNEYKLEISNLNECARCFKKICTNELCDRCSHVIGK